MARYVVRYTEETQGIIAFDANSKEEAETLITKVELGNMEWEQLLNYSTKVKSSRLTFDMDLEEVKQPSRSIPIIGVTNA